MTLDPEIEQRIEEPAADIAVREARLSPAEAVEHMRIRVPERGNRTLRRVLERANADKQLKGWWHVSNVNAVVRLEINDHSWVHIQIVANIALKLLRQLTKHGIEPSLVGDYGMRNEDAEVVVVLAALTHCIGMSVHRRGHEDWSLFLAEPKLRELLDGIYEEPDRTVVVSEVLQAITSHRADGEPLSLEAGILRVGDALDMVLRQLAEQLQRDVRDDLDVHPRVVVDLEALDCVDVRDVPPGLHLRVLVDALDERRELAIRPRRHLDPHLRHRLGGRQMGLFLRLI